MPRRAANAGTARVPGLSPPALGRGAMPATGPIGLAVPIPVGALPTVGPPPPAPVETPGRPVPSATGPVGFAPPAAGVPLPAGGVIGPAATCALPTAAINSCFVGLRARTGALHWRPASFEAHTRK